MPVLDTEVLFALNPRDSKHSAALRVLQKENLLAADTSILEFVLVLGSRGRKEGDVRESLLALTQILASFGVKEAKTLDLDLLLESSNIQMNHGLSFFDSMIAASALSLDLIVVGDDSAFDLVPELERISREQTSKLMRAFDFLRALQTQT